MSHEFSIMILIAATLLLLAAVCGVLFWGMTQSKDIADRGYTAISDITNLSDVILAVEQDGNMPAAACYTLLKEHPELIVRLTCHVCGKTTTGTELGDCLKSHMHGRVRLTLTEEESGGTYTAVISAG